MHRFSEKQVSEGKEFANVAIRCRPLIEKELNNNEEIVVDCSVSCISVLDVHDNGRSIKKFDF